MNRKLLIISSVTLFIGVLLAIFINFLTNDKKLNDWLSKKGLGTTELFVVVIAFTGLLIALEYFKFHNQGASETVKDKKEIVITQTLKAGDNSQNYQAGNNISLCKKDND